MERKLWLFALLTGYAAGQCTAPASIAALTRDQIRERIAAGQKDFFLYQRLLDLTPARPKPGALAAEFRTRLDFRPNDAQFIYLYGRALTGKNTPEAIQHLRRAVELAPDLPWTYLTLAEIYASPNFKDDQSLLAALRALRKLCPKNLDGFRYLDRIKDPTEASAWAAELRPLLEENTMPEHARYWSLLWGAEFRSTPETGHPELRKRVAADVKRLESLPPGRDLRFTLIDGYRLSGGTEAAARAESEIDSIDSAVFKEYRAWENKHGLRTRNNITPAERDAMMREQAALAAGWVRKWPNNLFAWTTRLRTLPLTPDWTTDQLEHAGERVLELDRQRDLGWTYISESLRVAQVWIRYGVRLEDSLRMAEEALAEISLGPEEPNDLTADSNAVKHMASERFGFDSSVWDAMGAVVDAAVKLNDLAKARAMLERMGAWLAANQDRRYEAGSGYASFERLAATYSGRVAEAEGRKLDALAYYAKAMSSGWVRDEIAGRARALWKEQGGSPEAWEALTVRPAPAKPAPAQNAPPPAWDFAAFEKTERSLPAFELRDRNGNPWTLAQLKGKRTFVNVWATWCGPCRQEFPHLQKLYELTKDRDDIQVLTLNVDDENPGLVAPFLSEYKATFPVVMNARPYVMEFIGMPGIPQNWLVDRNGVMRGKSHGFNDGVKDWPARMMAELERLP